MPENFLNFLKIEDPVLIFAVVMLIMLLAPLFVSRFKVPGLIGLILAGVVVGPNMLGMLERDGTFELLGTVGLLYLMFLAGLEINLNEFIRRRRYSLVFGSLTFLLPQVLGALGGRILFNFSWPTSILLASMFASHTLISFPIVSKLGLAKNKAVTTSVGGTILTDIAALLVLAVIAESVEHELTVFFWVRQAVLLALLVFLTLWLLPRIGFHFFRIVTPDGSTEFVFVMASVFLVSFAAHLARVEPIVGAFLAGIALSRLVPENSPLMNRLEFIGHTLFIPFFLISVGMLVDLRVFFAGFDAWMVAIYMSVAVILTKWLASRISARLLGFNREEGALIFGISVNQAAATLAAVLVGYRLEIFDSSVLNGTILMILTTCILGPWVTEKYAMMISAKSEPVASKPESEPTGRILVPISKADTINHLIDIALMLRNPKSMEPIHPLHVVQDGVNIDERMAVGERMLGIATARAVAADAPVAPLTRVDVNITGGILHALAEQRVSTLVMGWNGRVHSQFFAFHSILDRILHHTRQLLLVCRVVHPLNTTKRVIVAIPPLAETQPGFGYIHETLRRLAKQAGASIHVICVAAFSEKIKARSEKSKTDIPVNIQTISDWKALIPTLSSVVTEGDLILLLSARRARTAWQPDLVRLPGNISRDFPGSNFITVYPSDDFNEDDYREEEPEKPKLPEGLTQNRVLPDLEETNMLSAIRELLGTAFAARPGVVEKFATILEQNMPVELAQGTVLLHTHVEEVSEPTIFLGINKKGFILPDLTFPVRHLFILLSPADSPPERHLGALASLAKFVQNPDNIDAISGG